MGEDRRVNRLFCFGLGFSAEALARRLAAKGWSIAGTARDPANIERIRGQGYEVCRFAGEPGNAEPVAALAGTTHLLLSIPPGAEGDPALRHYRAEIPRLTTLEWIGYLSTVGVYGNHKGAVVDEAAMPRPHNERTKARVVAESGWLAFGDEIGHPVQVFRLAGIYGHGRGRAPSTTSPTMSRRRPRTSSPLAQSCWASSRRQRCHSRKPISRRWRGASMATQGASQMR